MIKIIFISVSIILILIVKYFKDKNKKKNLYIIPERIKERYKKITISYDKINVRTRGYYESDEGDQYPTKIQALDGLVKKNERAEIFKEVSVLTYDLIIRGKSIQLKSSPIYIPETLLLIKLKKQEFVDIYHDEINLELVYYDLAFLS